MDITNFIVSIIGAAVNFSLMADTRRGGKQAMYALVAVMLTLRAVKYGARITRRGQNSMKTAAEASTQTKSNDPT